MNCATAREYMLTADPAELEGRAAGPLFDHLGACAACRAIAEGLVAAHRELRESLAVEPAARAAAEVARGAIRSAQRRQLVTRRFRRGVPLAAAAILAGLLVLRRSPEAPFSPPARDAGAVPARFAVTAPPGKNVLVLQQPDTSRVIVVWFF